MTENFVREVIDRLARIEAKAEGYITGKAFAGWVIGAVLSVLLGFWGVGEQQVSKLEAKLEKALSESEKNIARATEEHFRLERGAIVDQLTEVINNSKAGGVEYFTPLVSAQWGSVLSMTDMETSDALVYLDAKQSKEFQAASFDVYKDLVAKFGTRTFGLDEIYIKDAGGNFVPAFPYQPNENK
ncbi:hypothetical protein AB1M95_05295 [Sulfitobacter sp. LCG007]